MARRMFSAIVTIALVLGGSYAVVAQERQDSTGQDEMMARILELAQPGDEHKLLQKLVGNWDAQTKMWMEPGADSMVTPGSCRGKMLLGGRFFYGEYSVDEGEFSGEGIFIIGFDRRHEKFTYIGLDTWGTYSMAASGVYDEATKSITMYGEDDDPVMGCVQKYNFVFHFNDDGTWKFEVIFLDDFHTQGKGPFKMVEVDYTRDESP